jgi:chitodextrinase
MAISRRTFIRTAAAAAAVSAAELATPGLAAPALAASPVGDVVGKITVGYQGWFAAIGDGSPLSGWWHWSNNWGQPPSPSNTAIVSWPDVREYSNTYQTAYANLGNGQPARLFSHYDQQTVDTHFRWMRDYGCDTAALQRFNPTGGEGPIRDAITAKVRTAAEAFGRKFYIMYDVTNWTAMQSEIKTDWTSKMSAYATSPAYARQNGKPVVCIWGFGFSDSARPFGATECLDVVNWFKGQGCYVIGGVPTYWRQGINDSRPGFSAVYHAFHMISPWMVGRTGDLPGLDSFYTNVNVPDQAECNASGIDYQPCVMPGDLSAGHRRHGDFYWRHFYNTSRLGCQGIYISMFDEYNEGNQIAKTAESAAMQPTNFPGRALDEDGTACSADYYLRITADGGRMFKGQASLTPVRPTQPITGGTAPTNLAAGRPTSASTSLGGFGSGNAVDADPNSYWESANNAFPQWLQVDLGSALALGSVVLRLPPNPAWGSRVQTLSVQSSSDGSSFATVVGSTGYTFNAATGNSVTVPLPANTTARYVRLNISANTGWPAGQIAQFEVWGTTGGGGDIQAPAAPTNLTSPAKTANSVSLSWSAATDNVGVAGYQVLRDGTAAGTTTSTSFTVTGLNAATAYTFTVRAFDAAGNYSAASAPVTVTTNPAPNANLALNKPTAESSHTQAYGSGNAVNGDPGSYWESVNNAFPQWLQVDLGAATTVGRIVLKLPPSAAWATRTQTLSVQGSTDGSSFATVVGSGGYTFNPATGNTVTIAFAATTTRYVRLNFTANTGWPAGQVGELEVYAS